MNIVTPEWLFEHKDDANVRILDVRSDVMNYMPGHVHNAVHLADFSLRAPTHGIPVQYLEPHALEHLFRRASVNEGQQVVVYSADAGVIGASMAMYALGLIGHTNVSFLDGGWLAYRNQFGGTQEFPFGLPDGTVTAKAPAQAQGVTLEEVKALIGQSGVKFVDARPAGAYLGVEKTWIRNGHIPGAVNIDWHSMVEGHNWHKLRPLEELQALVEKAGVRPEDDVVVYCGTSREASLSYFVFKHVLNFPRLRLYEGSWTEYSSDPANVVETKVN